jgi:hypothetical protein
MGFFSQPPYPLLAVGSLAWHMSRWGTAFSASFFLSHEGSALYGLLRPGPRLVVSERTSFAQRWETNRSLIRSSGRLRATLVVVGAAVRWPEPWRSISTPDDSIAA